MAVSKTTLLEKIRAAVRLHKSRREPEHPDAPYALVGAPKKPRTPLRSASAAVKPDYR
jgi:hypothetical protein